MGRPGWWENFGTIRERITVNPEFDGKAWITSENNINTGSYEPNTKDQWIIESSPDMPSCSENSCEQVYVKFSFFQAESVITAESALCAFDFIKVIVDNVDSDIK